MADVKPAAPAKVKLISKKPMYRLVVSTAKSKLLEVDGMTTRIIGEAGKTLEFNKHTVECAPADYAKLASNPDSSHMVDWMSVEDWKKLRQTDRKQAHSWRREVAENYKLHMSNQYDPDTAEELLEKVFAS